jgi:hypothetical protein
MNEPGQSSRPGPVAPDRSKQLLVWRSCVIAKATRPAWARFVEPSPKSGIASPFEAQIPEVIALYGDLAGRPTPLGSAVGV